MSLVVACDGEVSRLPAPADTDVEPPGAAKAPTQRAPAAAVSASPATALGVSTPAELASAPPGAVGQLPVSDAPPSPPDTPPAVVIEPIVASATVAELGFVPRALRGIDAQDRVQWRIDAQVAAERVTVDGVLQLRGLFGAGTTLLYAEEGATASAQLRIDSEAALPQLDAETRWIEIEERLRFPVGFEPRAQYGDLAFVDAQGTTRFTIPAPAAWDSGTRPLPWMRQDIEVTAPGEATLRTRLDAEWLRSETRRYPLYIDPSVSAGAPPPVFGGVLLAPPTPGEQRGSIQATFGNFYNDALQVTLDWGDGTVTTEDLVGGLSRLHSYAAPGVYRMSIQVCDYSAIPRCAREEKLVPAGTFSCDEYDDECIDAEYDIHKGSCVLNRDPRPDCAPCQASADCLAGSYCGFLRCRVDCNHPEALPCAAGFGCWPDGSCQDLDECSQNNGGCDANAVCTNRIGGRLCECPQGFAGDGESCTAISAEVTPPGATQLSDLRCSTTGDGVLFDYAWFVDGQLVQGMTEDLLPAGNFIRDDDIRCVITPTNLPGEPVQSDTRRIANIVPTLTSVALSPDAPTSADEITCAAQVVDPDADGVIGYTTRWFVNDQVQQSVEQILRGGFARGDRVRCEAVAQDDRDASAPQSSPEVVIANAHPEVFGAAVSPANPTAADVLSCNVDANDADSDPLTFSVRWFVDGAAIGNGATLEQAFARGQEVSCEVSVSDGQASAAALRSTAVTVGNIPPTAVVTMTPENPNGHSPLSCAAVTSDADGDTVSVRYEWVVNNLILVDDSQTYNGPPVGRGSEVECVAVLDDGNGGTARIASAPATLGNAAPQIVSIDLIAVPGSEDFSCLVDAVDIDGDSVTVTYVWTLDGVVIDDKAEVTGPFTADSVLRCEATPSDGNLTGATHSAQILAPNAPPVVQASFLGGNVAQGIYCAAQATDPEGDPITATTEFTVDGVPVDPVCANCSANIYGVLTEPGVGRKGQNLTCTLTLSDGGARPVVIEFPPAVVENSRPDTPFLNPPGALTSRDEWRCTGGGTDLDGDTLSLFITWSVYVPFVGQVYRQAGFDDVLRFSPVPGQRVGCFANAFDGTDYSQNGATWDIPVGDTPPVMETVSLDPLEPTALDPVVCNSTSSDFDGDGRTLLYKWEVNGIEVADQTAMTYTGPMSGGDTLRCTVTARGDFGALSQPLSAETTVVNTPPVLQSVAVVAPLGPRALQPLRCVPDIIDPDAVSPTIDYRWFINGTEIDLTTEEIVGEYVRANQVTCEVTVDDGSGPVTGTSPPLTILDTPAVITKVGYNPEPFLAPFRGAQWRAVMRDLPVECDIQYFDPDGDQLLIDYIWQWWTGADLVFLSNERTIPPQPFGTEIVCSANATDPITGQLHILRPGRVIVLDFPSQVDSVDLQPQVPHGLQTLTCSGTVSDPDGQGAIPTFTWTVNGEHVPVFTPTFSMGFKRDDVVECIVHPTSPGGLTGLPESISVTVVNAPPLVRSVGFSSPTGDREAVFTCVPDLLEVDGDPVTFSYVWQHEGVTLPGQTAATLDLSSFPAETFTRGETLGCIVDSTDGLLSGETASGTTTIVNALPTLTGVGVTPANPTRLDTLSCAEQGFRDADGDSSSPSYAWYEMGNAIPLQTGTELSAAGLSPGTQVYCEVTPGDGTDTGTPVQSETLTIGNFAPVATAVIAESVARIADTLTCVPGATDAEGDTVTFSYAWTVNGTEVPSETGSTLSGVFAEDDQVACIVTSHDGFDAGAPVETAALTISNTAPLVTSVGVDDRGVSPGFAACEPMTCVWTASDADGDAFSATAYRWLIGNNVVSTAETLDATVPVGAQLRCEATISDGQDESTLLSAPVSLVDLPPVVDGVDISPRTPTPGEALRCRALGIGSPCGGPLTYTYRWFQNDVLMAGRSGEVLTTNGLQVGAQISCEITASSDTAGSTIPQRSATVSIGSGQYLLTNNDASEGFGFSVSVPGDVDGDGLEDVVVAAPSTDGPNGEDAGRLYLFSGTTETTDQLADGARFVDGVTGGYNLHTTLCAFCSVYAPPERLFDGTGTAFGYNIGPRGEGLGVGLGVGTGDFDGDGVPDIVGNARFGPSYDLSAYFTGRSYVVSGAQFGLVPLSEAQTPGNTAATLIFGENGRNGVIGGPQLLNPNAGDVAGHASTLIGDFNGDGLDDLAFSAERFGADNPGAFYIVAGAADGAVVDLKALLEAGSPRVMRIQGDPSVHWIEEHARWSYILRPVGDLDGDGFDDVVVVPFAWAQYHYVIFGRPELENLSLVVSAAGVEQVFFGAKDGTINYDPTGLRLTAGRSAAQRPMIGGGDINADGLADRLYRAATATGSEFVVGYGTSTRDQRNAPLNWFQGNGGFTIPGIDDSNFTAERDSVAMGDINGDGFDDLITGTPEVFSRQSRGRVSVVYGGRQAPAGTYAEILANGGGFEVEGAWDGAAFGMNIDVGDINGDGLQDIAVSGSDEHVRGGAMVILGRDTNGVITHRGTRDDDLLEGTAGADVMVGGLGDDTMLGGGGDDAFSGGAGDDRMVVADANFRRVDGGTGQDTLATEGGVVLDLVALGLKVRGVEAFDLSAAGADELRISPRRLTKLSPMSDEIIVNGGAEDTLSLIGEGWTSTGNSDIEGTTYTRMRSGRATVYFQLGMQTRVGPNITTRQVVALESLGAGALVATLEANDSDGQIVGFTMDEPSGSFAINAAGDITVTASANLNFETQARYGAVVTATDNDGLQRQVALEIFVVDVDEPPVFVPQDPALNIDENPATGTVLTTVSATDPDGTDVVYSLRGPNVSSFVIDEETGAITATNTAIIDFETSPTITLTAVATDAGGVEGTQDLAIAVNDRPSNTQHYDVFFFARGTDPALRKDDGSLPTSGRMGVLHDVSTPVDGTKSAGVVTLTATTSGEVEYYTESRYTAGSVRMQYPATITVDFPDEVVAGSTVSVGSSFAARPGAFVSGESPDAYSTTRMDVRSVDYSAEYCVQTSCQSASVLMDGRPAYSVSGWTFTGTFSMVPQVDGTFEYGPHENVLSDANRNWNGIMDALAASRGQSLTNTIGIAGVRIHTRYIGLYTTGQVKLITEMSAGIEEIRGVMTFENNDTATFVVATPTDVAIPAGADANGDGRIDVSIRYEMDFLFDNLSRRVSTIESRMTAGEMTVEIVHTGSQTPVEPVYDNYNDGREVEYLGDPFHLTTNAEFRTLSIDGTP